MKHRYSPLPIESYFIPGTEVCEIRTISQAGQWSPEIWNLMWLSSPTIDTLPGSTAKGYWKNYRSWPELVRAVINDAIGDEQLRDALAKPPAVFHSWFCNQRDYTIFDVWDVAGPAWVETVADRADQAAMARLSDRPFIFTQDATLRIDYRKVA
jgi:hypothetical protein